MAIVEVRRSQLSSLNPSEVPIVRLITSKHFSPTNEALDNLRRNNSRQPSKQTIDHPQNLRKRRRLVKEAHATKIRSTGASSGLHR